MVLRVAEGCLLDFYSWVLGPGINGDGGRWVALGWLLRCL